MPIPPSVANRPKGEKARGGEGWREAAIQLSQNVQMSPTAAFAVVPVYCIPRLDRWRGRSQNSSFIMPSSRARGVYRILILLLPNSHEGYSHGRDCQALPVSKSEYKENDLGSAATAAACILSARDRLLEGILDR
jgi:hypothetical protein